MRIQVVKSPNGIKRVYLVEPYRNEAGQARNRTVKSYGRLDQLQASDPEVLDKLRVEAALANKEAAQRSGLIHYDTSEPNDGQLASNYGWWLIETVWRHLGLGTYLKQVQRERAWQIDVEAICRVLVASRVVWPGSKRAAIAKADQLLLGPKIDLAQTYQALDHLAELSERIQAKTRRALTTNTSRGLTDRVVFYDVTNYFFTTDLPDTDPVGLDGLRGQATRQDGYSKEHRLSPIIQMGLFQNSSGIPLGYRLFDGNQPDQVTLPRALADFKTSNQVDKIVVVADKAMNNQVNTGMLAQSGDDWVFSASARAATRKLQSWMLDAGGWCWVDSEQTMRVKSQVVKRSVVWITPEGAKVHKTVSEKIIARWSADHGARDRANRTDMLTKAQVLVDQPGKLFASNRRGVKKYVKSEQVDPATGLLKDREHMHLSIDLARVDHDARFDGLWLIHTSLLDTPDQEVLAHYHQLWRIEDTFRVSKTNLETRPVFVSTPAHIEAHFLTCFLALQITCLLHQQIPDLPIGQLLETLRQTRACLVGQSVYRLERPVGWDLIDQATAMGLDQQWATLTQLRTWHTNLINTNIR